MKRIEFRLTISGVNKNGSWRNGAGKNYSITKTMSDAEVERILEGKAEMVWYHDWGARISACILPSGSKPTKSDGFYGYDWMVSNIISHGDTHDRKDIEP
jgi:hypothetical protein